MSSAVRFPATAADLARLPDELGAEVIDGVVVEKAAPSFEHGDAQSALVGVFKGPYQHGRGGPGGWWMATEVEIELQETEVYRPDVVGWRKVRVPDRPRGRPIRVRPDFVAEVLSSSNTSNDLGKKLFAYFRAGVPNYWIVDPERETLTVYRVGPDGYVLLASAGKDETVRAEPFEEVELPVALLFGG